MWAGRNVFTTLKRPPEARRRKKKVWIRPRSALGMSLSPRRGDGVEDDIEQQAEVVASGASPGAEIVEAAVNGEAGRRDEAGRKIADISGIGWITLASVVATQVALLWLFAWLAGPSIREQVATSVKFSFLSIGLGVLGTIPLFGIGVALKTRDWAWAKKIDEITLLATAQLFGTKRQVAKALILVIPLASLVGFAEEFTFRGYLPLILAVKTGMPAVAIVGVSGVIFGVFHAATWAYFVNAAVCGMYFHWLLLSTGNIFVPIVTHAVYDAFALIFCHLKVTRQSVGSKPDEQEPN
ncbi:unnamed protein product [Ascophyllum nodosum]